MQQNDILEELEEIWKAFDREVWDQEEVRSRWCALMRKANEGDRLLRMHVDHLASILRCGWMIEMRAGEYRRAAEVLRLYFGHPEIEQADIANSLGMPRYLAYSLLCAGEEPEALAICRSLLDSPIAKVARLAPRRLNFLLLDYLELRPDTQRASAPLSELVYEIVCRLRRRTSPRYRPREGATYAEVRALLERTPV